MNVVKARHAGACYGVQRALDMAYEALEGDGKAYTLGPLIHNPQVVKELEECGGCVIDDLGEVNAGGTVIIRSHGVIPQVKQEIESRGLPMVDATCPHVARAQSAASDLAGQCGCVIVVGEEGHPEVESLRAYAQEAGSAVAVVCDPGDLPEELAEPLGIVVQTTQSESALDRIVEELNGRGLEPLVRNTICFATHQRQAAASELAGKVDALVVIGGRNSSNTTRLYEICKALCPRTFHIEAAQELDAAWFDGCTTVGVTAGASTPEDQIDTVVAVLESI